MANDDGRLAERAPQERLDDHAAIDRLADELVPALVAKLGANGLGELEVREGTWRVRLRMPADGPVAAGRRATAGRGSSRAADAARGERARGEHARAARRRPPPGSGTLPSPLTSRPSPRRWRVRPGSSPRHRQSATSARGPSCRPGRRSGPATGSEAWTCSESGRTWFPADGLIGATLVAAGEPVEYGQAVILLERLGEPRPRGAGTAAAEGDVPATAARDGDASATAAAEDDVPGRSRPARRVRRAPRARRAGGGSRLMFERVLIANRGEIAVRILRACRDARHRGHRRGYSEADRDSLAAQLADEAICIGPADAKRSYLSPSAIISAAIVTGCEAIHPGYGFLSEDGGFAEAVAGARADLHRAVRGRSWTGSPPRRQRGA